MGIGVARPVRALLPGLLALVLVGAGIVLGRWQLARAAGKESLQSAIDAQARRAPLAQADWLSMDDPAKALHRHVHLRGLWLASDTVYLDNRQMRGQPGFHVLTPLALEGSNAVVLVQRGWVPRDFMKRTRLAPVSTPSGQVEIAGRVAAPPARLLELGRGGEMRGASPRPELIRQNLSLDAFRAETGLPLRTDLTIWQDGGPSEGLLRDWPAAALGIEKHYGYAFQWFGLAALIGILYVWFQFIAPFRRARRA